MGQGMASCCGEFGADVGPDGPLLYFSPSLLTLGTHPSPGAAEDAELSGDHWEWAMVAWFSGWKHMVGRTSLCRLEFQLQLNGLPFP